MTFRACALGMSVLGSLLFANAASAASVTATFYALDSDPKGVQPGTSVMSLTFNTTINYNPAFAGVINWHDATSADWSSGLNPQLQSILGPGGTFSTFCIEGTQDIVFGQTETWADGVVPLTSAPIPVPGIAQLTELFDRSYATIGTDDELAAAFQIAIYEIVYDGIPTPGGVDASAFTAGNFQATGDPTAVANAIAMLNGITGSGYANTYTVYALTDGTIQDQIFVVPNAVPVPAALPSGLALLLGLATFRKVRSKLRG